MSHRRNFRFSLGAMLGAGAAGMTLALFIAIGYSASGNARFCASCHSMEHVNTRLLLSNHKQFACVECHLPDASLPRQATYKAQAGLNDLVRETLRIYPAAIHISEKGKEILRGNCVRCHYSTIENSRLAEGNGDCLKCHRFLVHGRGLDKGGIKVE
jgi:cytochrome c nitrite reductase small subunit